MLILEQFLGSWAITSLITLTTILLLYWFSTYNHAYWKKRGVPYHKPLPLIGSLGDNAKKPTQDIELDRYKKYGPLYGYFEGNRPLLSVGDPALLRDILVKDFPAFRSRRDFGTGEKMVDTMLQIIKGGDEWKRIRNIVTAAFTTGKIKRMMGIFNDCAEPMIQNFRNLTNEGKPIDAKRIYGAYSMDVIACSVFSTKINSHNDPDNQFVAKAKSHFTQEFNWRYFLFIVAPKLAKFLGITVISTEVLRFFKQATLQIMEERKRTGQTRNDLLQLLMDTAKEVSDEQKEDVQEKGNIAPNNGDTVTNRHILKNVTSKHLSLDELVAQCLNFFLAGYEMKASNLTFSSYLLASNPDVQDRLRQEVDEAIIEAKGELTYEAIQSMKYLDNVISETLRMYPQFMRLERKAEHDYKLGDTGITIPKDMIISVPIYAIHRDPKWFPNPEKFDPDRFTPEEHAKRDQYAYLPFGAGPRNCVVMRYTRMEAKVCLAHVIANFRIRNSPETKEPLEFMIGQDLMQPRGIFLQMEARNDSPLEK